MKTCQLQFLRVWGSCSPRCPQTLYTFLMLSIQGLPMNLGLCILQFQRLAINCGLKLSSSKFQKQTITVLNCSALNSTVPTGSILPRARVTLSLQHLQCIGCLSLSLQHLQCIGWFDSVKYSSDITSCLSLASVHAQMGVTTFQWVHTPRPHSASSLTTYWL